MYYNSGILDKERAWMSDNGNLTFWQMFKSTFMSFIGVQKNEIRERDFEKGNPIHFILIGLLLTIIFIFSVIVVVKIILSQATL